MTTSFTSYSLPASLYRLSHLIVSSLIHEFKQRKHEDGFSLTFKRIGVIVALAIFLLCNAIIQHFFLYLDTILYPDFHLVDVNSNMLFILSNARSGSTLTHQLVLAANNTRFTSPSLFNLIFAQSITQRRACDAWWWFDAMFFRGLIWAMIVRVDGKIYQWTLRHAPHPFSALSPDEDEWAMWSVGACQLLALFFPLLSPNTPLMRLINFDQSLSSQETQALWNHFANLVKRHLYHLRITTGKDDWIYVSKNPTFTLRVASLQRRFPRATFCLVVRNPHKAIPSMVSYIASWWHFTASPTVSYPMRDALQGMCQDHYTYPIQVLGDGLIIVKYDNIVMGDGSFLHLQPIFNAFGIEQVNLNAMRQVHHHHGDMVYEHTYSIEETLGMTEQDFDIRHAKVFTAFPEFMAGSSSSMGKI